MDERYKKIEELREKYDIFGVHKKIKVVTGASRMESYILIKINEENILDATQKIRRWEKYIKELFEERRTEFTQDRRVEGKPISESEVVYAIKCIKDGISAKMVKLI